VTTFYIAFKETDIFIGRLELL